jgi:hypothetical protein
MINSNNFKVKTKAKISHRPKPKFTHFIGRKIYLTVFFYFMLQIIGGFPFTTDIVLISGTDLESSRVEERVNSLTGFHHFCIVYFLKYGVYIYVLS